MPDLLETLSLAMALEVNLELENDRLKATPKANITDELRAAIDENLEDLMDHLLKHEHLAEYRLLTDIARAGITLDLNDDGAPVAKPSEAVLASGLRERLAQNRDFLKWWLEEGPETVRQHSEVHLLVRQRFDTEPYEPPPTKDEAWTDANKARFFRGGKA